MMIVVDPSTPQKTSWFSELSRVPRSTTVTGRWVGLTWKWMISISEAANRFLSDLPTPGTPRTTPAPASAIKARNIQSLLPDDLRRGGRCTSGRSFVGAACGGDVAVDGDCREKFMEGLP